MKSFIVCLTLTLLLVTNLSSQPKKIESIADAQQQLLSQTQQVFHPNIQRAGEVTWGDESKKGWMNIQHTITDSKGKAKIVKSELYIHFIDTLEIAPFTSANACMVKLVAAEKQPLFKWLDSGKEKYTSQVFVPVNDMQGFRQVQQALKYLFVHIPENRSTFSGKADAFQWLTQKVTTQFAATGINYSVQAQHDSNTEQVSLTVQETNDKGKSVSRKFELYLADFNRETMRVDVLRNTTGITISHKKYKAIKYYENGILKSFVNKLFLPLADVKLAFDTRQCLMYLIDYKEPVKKELVLPIEVKKETDEKQQGMDKKNSKSTKSGNKKK